MQHVNRWQVSVKQLHTNTCASIRSLTAMRPGYLPATFAAQRLEAAPIGSNPVTLAVDRGEDGSSSLDNLSFGQSERFSGTKQHINNRIPVPRPGTRRGKFAQTQ